MSLERLGPHAVLDCHLKQEEKERKISDGQASRRRIGFVSRSRKGDYSHAFGALREQVSCGARSRDSPDIGRWFSPISLETDIDDVNENSRKSSDDLYRETEEVHSLSRLFLESGLWIRLESSEQTQR